MCWCGWWRGVVGGLCAVDGSVARFCSVLGSLSVGPVCLFGVKWIVKKKEVNRDPTYQYCLLYIMIGSAVPALLLVIVSAPPTRPPAYSYARTDGGRQNTYAVDRDAGKMRVTTSNGVRVQDQNFTVVCLSDTAGTLYSTYWEGSSGPHGSNLTKHCTTKKFRADRPGPSLCQKEIDVYDSLLWAAPSWVLLNSTTCDTFGPCDVYGPQGGDWQNTSFAFAQGTSRPLYSKGCYDRWCSVTPYLDWVAAVPAATALAPDLVCTSSR
jgi:hypothetical protein